MMPKLSGIAEIALLVIAAVASLLIVASRLPTSENAPDPDSVRTAFVCLTVALAGLACAGRPGSDAKP